MNNNTQRKKKDVNTNKALPSIFMTDVFINLKFT